MAASASPASSPFLSTLPARGATWIAASLDHTLIISIHAPREGSDRTHQTRRDHNHTISIHAPREGSDHGVHQPGHVGGGISIHAPREGSDSCLPMLSQLNAKFLSTLPARGATPLARSCVIFAIIFLSTLPARGATKVPLLCLPRMNISIHAPREGSDDSRPYRQIPYSISIHAPREGSDRRKIMSVWPPRSFLSTLPARGATAGRRGLLPARRHFYPRSPRGERPADACNRPCSK